MPISFQCPHCGKKLKAPDNAVGKTSTCPGCGNKVTCPEPVYDADVVEMTPLESPAVDPYADLGTEEAYGVVDMQPIAEPSTESRRPCPMCGEMILTTAAKCRFCGEVFDPTLKKGKGRGGKGGKRAEIRTIARNQKYLINCVLIEIVAYVGLLVSMAAGRPSPQGATLALAIVCALALLASGVAGMVFACMLATRVYGTAAAVLVVLLSCLPCFGLIALLVVNSKATNILRDAGVEVGFLGANLADL
jgi:predicted RNA-binding Zn-ribbon protein involved in translation (DUF1610 family)